MTNTHKMAVTFSTAFVISLALANVGAMIIPQEALYRCKKSSPHLDDCVKEGLIRAIRQFKGGDISLGLPSLDPLEVPHLSVRHDETNFTLELIFKQILIMGLSDISIVRVKTNLDDVKKLEVTGKIPALYISGHYSSEGLIVNFPLHSIGAFSVNMTEVTSSWVIYLKEEVQHRTKYLQVEGFTIDMMPVSVNFRPADQLNDDNRLGEAVNLIMNENSSEMYSAIKNKLAGVLSDVLTEYANAVLSRVPEDVFLAD